MNHKKLNGALVMAAISCTITFGTPAISQAPQGNKVDAAALRSAIADRQATVDRMGLAQNVVGLSSDQKAQVDSIVDEYLAEQRALDAKYPVSRDQPSNDEAMKERGASRVKMTARLRGVLNEEQRKAWQAAMTTRRQNAEAFVGR